VVEALVVEREMLGVALDPVDDQTVLVGPLAGGVEQLGSQVEADDLRAGGSCAYCDVPGTGRDVEHLLARRDLQPGEQVARRHLVDHLGNRGVVSRGPGSSVCALEVRDSSHDCVLSIGGRFEFASGSGSRGGHGRPSSDGASCT
jgi:hypothetical protein